MSAHLVYIQNLHKYYGHGQARNHVLKGIDLSIEQGEFLSITGSSGSGKTTLLNILGGLDRHFQGMVKIQDKDILKLKDHQLSRLRSEWLGFVFQSFNLLPHLNCLENVMIPGYFRPKGLQNATERAIALLKAVGLEDKIYDSPTELSGGQKQRVSIARALFNRPRMILCDEPTGSLDQKTSAQIMTLFRDLNRQEGISFVIVTHDPKVSQSCDRTIQLEDGLILRDGASLSGDTP